MPTKIPGWAWIVVPLIGLLAVGIRGATQASYYRGIADDAEQRLEVQEVVLDSVKSVADSLGEELAQADSVVIAQRAIAERDVARLSQFRQEERARSQSLSESLRASLDSTQVLELDLVVDSYARGSHRSRTSVDGRRANEGHTIECPGSKPTFRDRGA